MSNNRKTFRFKEFPVLCWRRFLIMTKTEFSFRIRFQPVARAASTRTTPAAVAPSAPARARNVAVDLPELPELAPKN